MQQVTLSNCHQVLSKPIGGLNQIELALRKRLHEIWKDEIDRFALYAQLSVELDEKGLGSQLVKI